MKELENVEMTTNLLLKNSDIVMTIRRVNVVVDVCGSLVDVGDRQRPMKLLLSVLLCLLLLCDVRLCEPWSYN